MGETASGAEAENTSRPQLRVVRGEPEPEELAALTAVVTARARTPSETAHTAASRRAQSTSRWADRSRQLRHPLPRGADAWRAAVREG